MDFFEAAETRHSYRGIYTNDVVCKADLMRIIDAGRRAPSGCNAQTTSFIVVTNAEIRAQFAKLLDKKTVQTAPAFIVVVTEKVTFDFGPDFRDFGLMDFELEDYAAAVQNILLAATALGYASCWLDGAVRGSGADAKIAALLDVPQGKRVRCILPIGVPANPGKQPKRKPFDEKVTWLL